MLTMASLVVSAFLADSSDLRSYAAALAEAQQHQQPLLVLVGAAWCPACRTMELHVLPQLRQRGRLSGVSIAKVDAENEPELARRLMQGNAIPQLIVFSQRPDGTWYRAQVTGAVSQAEVDSLVQRAKNQLVAPTNRPAGAIGN